MRAGLISQVIQPAKRLSNPIIPCSANALFPSQEGGVAHPPQEGGRRKVPAAANETHHTPTETG